MHLYNQAQLQRECQNMCCGCEFHQPPTLIQNVITHQVHDTVNTTTPNEFLFLQMGQLKLNEVLTPLQVLVHNTTVMGFFTYFRNYNQRTSINTSVGTFLQIYQYRSRTLKMFNLSLNRVALRTAGLIGLDAFPLQFRLSGGCITTIIFEFN